MRPDDGNRDRVRLLGRDLPARTLALAVVGAITLSAAIVFTVGVTLTSGVEGRIVQGDAVSYFAYLPSLVLDGDLDLTNQFRVLIPRPESSEPGRPFGAGAGGRAANPFPVGPALLWLPGYLLGLGLDRLASAAGILRQTTGYGFGAVAGAALVSILAAGAAVFLGYRVARRVAGPLPALAASVFAWLGTPALYYTVVAPLYSHAVAWFAVALMLWALDRALGDGDLAVSPAARTVSGPERPDPFPGDFAAWLAVGLSGGLAVAIRLQDLPLLAIPAAALLAAWIAARPRGGTADEDPAPEASTSPAGSKMAATTPRLAALGTRIGALGLGAIVGFAPQELTWYRLHGEWLPWRQAARATAPGPGKLADLLFSAAGEQEGWIVWSPLVALAIVGLLLLALRSGSWRVRGLAAGALLATAGLIVVDLIHPFGAGAAFGARRYVSLTPVLALGLAAFGSEAVMERAGRGSSIGIGKAEWAVWTVAGLLVAWELWLLVCYEMLVVRHGIYPDLARLASYSLGLGGP